MNCAAVSAHEYRRLGQYCDEWLCPICCLPPLTDSYFDASTSSAGSNSPSGEVLVSKQKSGLKCVSFNARSLVNKASEYMAWIDTNCYDIIAVG